MPLGAWWALASASETGLASETVFERAPVKLPAFVLDAARTPFGRRGGALARWHPVDLASELLAQLLGRAGVPHGAVDALIVGCASQVGAQSGNIARRAGLASGLPEGVPAFSLECHAASSAQAVVLAAQRVSTGESDLVLAGGVEVMSAVPLGAALAQPTLGKPLGRRLLERYGREHPPPGLTAEMVARRSSLRREALDSWAWRSWKKATAAQRRKPRYLVSLPMTPSGGGLVQKDEALQGPPTRSAIRELLPAYDEGGLITAANIAAEGDGASGVVVASRKAASELGAHPLAQLSWLVSAGGPPALWPLATIPAALRVLDKGRLRAADIDWWYVHESSAAAVLAWAAELGVPLERVNPEGGELATTSPVGAAGAALFAAATACLAEGRGERVALCVAGEGGVAVAAVLERVT